MQPTLQPLSSWVSNENEFCIFSLKLCLIFVDLSPNAWVIANNTNTVGVEEEEFYKSLFEGNKHNNNNYDDNPVLSKLPLPRPVMAVTNGTIRFSAIGCSLIEKQRSVSGYRHRSSSQQSNITASSTVSSTNGRLSSLSSWISSSSSNFLNTSNFTRMVMKTWNEVVVGKDDAGALDEFAATIPTVLAESPHRDLEDRARVSSSSSSSMPVQSLSASLSSSSSITTAYGVEKGDRWIGSDSVSEFSVFLEGPRKCQRVNIKEDGVSMHKLEEYLSFKITSRVGRGKRVLNYPPYS